MNHPGISTGLLTDATAICDKFSKQVEEYSKENTAGLESLKTEAETRAQAVVSVCVSERAKGKDDGENKDGAPPLRKRYNTFYELPHEPTTGKQLYALPCMWQGSNHSSNLDADVTKITGRLAWKFSKSSVGERVFPLARFYIVWEIALAGSKIATAFEPDAEVEKDEGDEFINEFTSFMKDFNVKS